MNAMSVAARVRSSVLASRERVWKPEDFPGAPLAVAKALSRLEKAGELRRIRRGLYWRGALTPLGMAPPSATRLTKELVGTRGVGPGEGSAALALGLSTHVPRTTTIAVPGRVPASPVGTVRFVSRSASTKRLDERLRPAEVALVESLRDWDRYVEAPESEAYARIGRLIEDGEIRVERVAAASGTEPARVRSRLRALLSALGFNDAADRVPPPRHVKYSEPRTA
ncbi:MAG TPA: hypothetical protein ENH00_14940 [Actinobacteria bacterium]|nr:hypothetical protein BMS3Bbin01_00355 [bacterium BMS3Bbin01]HDH27458.1 hypothetical protein [Actinomycetota bacterium]